jgi:hypothetical protein
MADPDEDQRILKEYVERFGPIPDMRAMEPEAALLVVDKAREALDRGRALTREEWGIPDDIPDNVTI